MGVGKTFSSAHEAQPKVALGSSEGIKGLFTTAPPLSGSWGGTVVKV